MDGALRRSRGALLPGVVELLDELGRLDHVLVGLLTGNAEHGAWAKLGHYGLADRFSFGGFGDHHTDRNDIAAAALAAAQREAAERWHDAARKLQGTMVVGDTISDVRCAKSIDAYAVGVATGSTSREELAENGADLVLADLSDCRPILSVVQSLVES
jgi:phosphoglycolate phosphatase